MNFDNKRFYVELVEQEPKSYKFKFTEVDTELGEERKVYWSQKFTYLFICSSEFSNINDFAMYVLTHQGLAMRVDVCNDYITKVDDINMYIKIYDIPEYFSSKKVIHDEINKKLFDGHEEIAQIMVDDIKIKERLFIINRLYGHRKTILYESIVMFLMLRLDKEGMADPLNECNLIYESNEDALNAARSYGCTPYLYYMACKMLHIYRYKDENDFIYESPCYPGMIYTTNVRMPIGDIRLNLEEQPFSFPDFIIKTLLLHKEKQLNYA